MRFFTRVDSSSDQYNHYYAILSGKIVNPKVMLHFMIDNETGLMYLTHGIVPIEAWDKGQYGIMFCVPDGAKKNRWLTEIPGELFLKVMLESKVYEASITDADNQS